MSRRTVFRDIESLREAGVPIEFDADARRYRIDNSHFLPPTNLTLDEALWLLLAVERASATGPDAMRDASRQAAAKIEASLPTAMREQLRSVAASVAVKPTSSNPLRQHDGVYQTLLRASVERVEARIEYDSLTEFDRISTTLRPYQLLFHARSWYAIGRSSLHNEIRTFNIGRVRDAALGGRRFTVPRDFNLRKHLGNAWGIMPDGGPDHAVHLRFGSLVAKNVAEVLWHPTQEVDYDHDGSLHFRADVSGLNEIVWWILGYGDQVEVIGPPKLRRLVAKRLAAAARHYA